jgi:hypothetical protein
VHKRLLLEREHHAMNTENDAGGRQAIEDHAEFNGITGRFT